MRKNLFKNIICGALIGSMSFLAGVSTIAENDITMDNKKDTIIKVSADNHKQYLKDAVVKLVQEGKLSKEKADKILEFKEKRAEEFKKLTKEQRQLLRKEGKRSSLLKELIQEGIITEAEAQLIKDKLREMKDARLNEGLQSLVEKGVLTPTDIDNIRSYMLKVREERKESIDKLKSMTPEQKEEYFREYKKSRKDILNKMVDDKVITKKQAEEIRKVIPELNKSRMRKFN
jgi:uncharacterized protein YutE (UPF0331/DUF86 family)